MNWSYLFDVNKFDTFINFPQYMSVNCLSSRHLWHFFTQHHTQVIEGVRDDSNEDISSQETNDQHDREEVGKTDDIGVIAAYDIHHIKHDETPT